MSTLPKSKAATGTETQSVLKVRILGTTDVHSNLLPFDYFTNQQVTEYGLTRTATLIREARNTCRNSLLFDNGDYLQGTPVSDLTAIHDKTCGDQHPAILAMNTLRYDAATLGNHEFNFGLDWLTRTLSHADFPITCANLVTDPSTGDTTPLFEPYLLLDRKMQDEQGQSHDIRIGVIGLLPPQTTVWDRYHLSGRAQSLDIVETAQRLVPEIRTKGADIIVALAHSGIEDENSYPMMENAALQLGAVPGIDAIIAGHTHQVFPNVQFNAISGIDAQNGTLNGTPAVMAGARGSYLGVVDLELTPDAAHRWTVNAAHAEVRPLLPDTPEDTKLRSVLDPFHSATIRLAGKALGQAKRPLHSFLSLARPCDALRLVTQAKIQAVQQVLKGTDHEGLPILAGAAPFKTGGRAGPNYFTNIPAGPLCLRHAADLYSFPNLLSVLRLTGAEIRDWLERAAVAFNQITPGQQGQFLCNPTVPGHQFDMIDGITYEIDLSGPARYNLSGRLENPEAYRICNVRFDGKPLDDDQIFLLATNNYRTSGGGPYKEAAADQFVHISTQQLRDIVADYILSNVIIDESAHHDPPTWRFRPLSDTQVLYDTSPAMRCYPEEIKALSARDLGDTDMGFMRLAFPI